MAWLCHPVSSVTLHLSLTLWRFFLYLSNWDNYRHLKAFFGVDEKHAKHTAHCEDLRKVRCPSPHWTVGLHWKPTSLQKELKAASVLPLQLPNFINTTLPPHEQVTAQEIDSYFRQELIYKRNERMGKRVMTLLQENEDKSCFFAFGAGLGRRGGGVGGGGLICRILQGWGISWTLSCPL